MKRSVMSLGIVMLTTQCLAADDVGKWYLNPQYGYTWLDDDFQLDDDDNFGVAFGRHLNERLSVELGVVAGRFRDDTGAELDSDAVSVDALFAFNRRGAVAPYFTLGSGYLMHETNTASTDEGVLAQAGVGLMIDAGANAARSFMFQLRPEAKYRYEWIDGPGGNEFAEYLVNLGFTFNFGAPARAVAKAPEAAASTVATAAAEPPPPAPVLPPDGDNDGVLDGIDRCPDTAAGKPVNTVGCDFSGSVTLHGVGFETDSAQLTAASLPLLDLVSTDLKRYPGLRVELQGHTDDTGSDAHNLQLSQQRAEAVFDYLVRQGVGAERLAAKGYGEEQAVADNRTEAGRVRNRRVVMLVIENPGDITVKGEQREF